MDSRTVGILGGGQLGRMLVEAANRLNIKIIILDAPQSPAKQINATSDHVDGSFSDSEAIMKLAGKCDILTAEIEHIDTHILESLEKQKTVVVHPSPLAIRTIQDKYLQKQHLQKHSIPTPESYPLQSNDRSSVLPIAEKVGYPLMIKSRTLAYDGRGNFVVSTAADIDSALKTLGGKPLYIERWATFTKELAVMVVRSANGLVRSYPTVETIHQNNICHLVIAPAQVPLATQRKARALAEKAVGSFQGAGVFGVEMFWFSNTDTLMINEIAPRPHNSGHYTIEACPVSQYEAHLRAILDLPLPEGCTDLTVPAIMLNILGTDSPTSYLETCQKALEIPGAHIHLYGKEASRKGRKMGHITFTANSMAACEQLLGRLIPMKESAGMHPEVAVIMGSDSDLPVMAAGCQILEDFGVKSQVTIVSAHRTPERMVEFAKSAASRGIKVIIAGAGGMSDCCLANCPGAAHLPGMVAAMTALPVIGVPVKATHLDGLDSLLSIVQMPRGIPVATVAINNSTNAALLALRIIGGSRPKIFEAMDDYLGSLKGEVGHKIDKLENIGWREYLANK